MKKILNTLLFITITLSLSSQKINLPFSPPISKIEKNILLIAVEHDSTSEKLLSDSSKNIFCNHYSEIVKAAKNRQVIYLLEGVRKNNPGYPDKFVRDGLNIPDCISTSNLFMGVDNRQDTSRKTLSALSVLEHIVYSDNLDGQEKTLVECMYKNTILNFYNIPDSNMRNHIYKSAKEYSEVNKKFENYILKQAKEFEGKGYFVVVICGAAHAVKIAMENPKIGYILCTPKSALWESVKSAKMTRALENL